jgi:hypothetical protein
MILVLGDCIINMDKVAIIDVLRQNNDGTLDILIRTTAIVEWQMHNPGVGPGFSPIERKLRIKEKIWSDLIQALKNNERVFVLEEE